MGGLANFMKKIILFSTIICSVFFFSVSHALASTEILSVSKDKVGRGEQFYVDVLLDPQDVSINGVEGSIKFPENLLSFVRAEEGKSIITFWIQKPTSNNGAISFAGIIPSGFSGFIDPFNSTTKAPGLIIRLVFEAKSTGGATIEAPSLTLTLNDGEGTTLNTPPTSTYVYVDNSENKVLYKTPDTTSPTLSAYITRDENLFNNRYTLVFQAEDKESGIESVMIKEGSHDWKKIESPYLLEDQSRHNIINVRATNFSGNTFTLTIEPIPYNFLSPFGLILVIAFAVLLYVILKKKHVFKQ